MKSRALRSSLPMALLMALGVAAFPAGINVDHIELLTHGSLENGTFTVSSRLYYDMSLAGGDKFAGLLRLEFLSASVEEDLYTSGLTLSDSADLSEVIAKLNALVSPRLRTAAVTARRVFGSPLEAEYFVGYLDTICSGDDYMTLFGSSPFGTELRGPMVYPEGVGGNADLYYEGLDAVYGTGLRLGLVNKASAYYLYAYQDADIARSGAWSGLLRAMFDSGSLKLELFAGGSVVAASPYGLYRAGLLFDYAPGTVGEFFAQVGMTHWDPADAANPLGIDNFYFLFEPRINFDPGNLAITVFYHPAWYRQKATEEQGSFDLNLNLRFGDVSKNGSQGGVSTLISFRSSAEDKFRVNAAPYYSMITSGVEWNFKLGLDLFPAQSPWYGMFKPYIGVKSSY